MARQYEVSQISVNNEWRSVLIVQDESTTEPLEFPSIRTIIAEPNQSYGEATIKVYTTEGYIMRTYPPEPGYNYYTYWFMLAKNQEAAPIANQLAEENAVLNEALNIIEGVDRNGNPTV